MSRAVLVVVTTLAASVWILAAFIPQMLGEGDRNVIACSPAWSSGDVLQKALVLAGVACLYLAVDASRRDRSRTVLLALVAIGLAIAWAGIATC